MNVHDDPQWVGTAIIAAIEVQRKVEVWNLAVEEDETYHAEGIVVHNCRSIIVPIVVGSNVAEGDFITAADVEKVKGLADAKFLSEQEAAFDYDPNQPRDPSGLPTGGRWKKVVLEPDIGPLIADAEGNLTDEQKRRVIEIEAAKTARALGFDPNQVKISDKLLQFEVDGRRYSYGGSANSMVTADIVLYPKALNNVSLVPGMVAHEFAHVRYEGVQRAVAYERERMQKDTRPDMIKPDGSLRDQFKKDYPLYTKMQAAEEGQWKKLTKDDVVTEYSQAYWDAWNKGKMNTRSAMHETIAEIARLEAEGVDLTTRVKPSWRRYYKTVKDIHNALVEAR